MAAVPDPQVAQSWIPAKSWTHFVAGGYVNLLKSDIWSFGLTFRSLGGMCGAIVTSPFDVVKTRLQSSMFAEHPHVTAVGNGALSIGSSRSVLWSFVETGHILRYALFLGSFYPA
jgi:solute carrier family 25 protein 33/36